MFDYRLALATGVDIPIPELGLTLHQPIIKEIAMIGESTFFMGAQLLCLNKSMYVDEALLEQTTNFQIFMTLISDPRVKGNAKESVIQVLTLLFPYAKIAFTPRSIFLNFDGGNVMIDEGNFEVLQNILNQVFCLNKSDESNFNPKGKKAKEIAEKLMKARQRVAKQKEHENGGSMFGQYLSILTIATGSMSLFDCCKLTMFQLYDLVERYTLYTSWDLDIRSRMAGAKGDKPVENWMKNIH